MSKDDKSVIALLILAGIGVATIVAINWLESNPNCDKGCRTQLEHLKEHVLADLLRAGVQQLGLLLG
jgi:hypothetical protein